MSISTALPRLSHRTAAHWHGCLVAAMLLATTGLAYADAPQAVAMSRTVGLVIEPLGDDAKECKVETAQVRDTAATVLADSGWTLKEGAPDYLYVNVSVIYQQKSASCVFNIALAIGRRLLTGYGGHVLAFTARTGALGVTPVASANRTVIDKLHALTKRLLASAEEGNL
jgi:hypothetical protein